MITPSAFHLPRIKAALRIGQNDLKYHNSVQPISQLPEHVLCSIFTLVAADSDVSSTFTQPRNPWSWVCMTYVCHSWRKLLLSYPDIWKYVDFSHPKWYNITFPRAKLQPLEISAVVGRHNIALLYRSLQLGHQIGSINLNSSLHHIHGLLPTLAHPNPALQSMIVRVNTAGHGVEDNVYNEPAFPMVGPVLPDMKYLELHSAPFYLVSPRYASLTNLHLYDLTPCERPSLQHFLYALSRYPLLEELTLDNAFPLLIPSSPNSIPFPRHGSDRSPGCSPCSSPTSSRRTHSPSSSQSTPLSSPSSSVLRIQLAHLRSINLVGPITDVAVILDSLFLPPNVKITCQITSFSGYHESLPRLVQALSVHSHAASAAGFLPETLVLNGIHQLVHPPSIVGLSPHAAQSPALGTTTLQGVRVRTFNRYYERKTTRRSPSPHDTGRSYQWLDLTFGPDLSQQAVSADEILVRSLTSIWSSLPSLNRVHTLALHDLDFVTQKTWTAFLKDLGSLQVVDITGHAPSGFVWALLLNANACIQREQREKERREKREEKKALMQQQQGFNLSPTRDHTYEDPRELAPLLLPPPVSPLSPSPIASKKLFIPHLRDFYVYNVDCSSGGYMVAFDSPVPINSHSDLDDSRFLDVLLAYLKARYQVQNPGAPLPEPSSPSSPSSSSPLSSSSPMSLSPILAHSSCSPPIQKLRSLSIANCSYTSRKTVLEIREYISHLIWDQRGTIKDDGSSRLPEAVKASQNPVARYRKMGGMAVGGAGVRHYYRLQTLMDEL